MGSSRINGYISSHCIGSKAEGTSIMESDTDDLFIWGKIMICQPVVHQPFTWKKVMIWQNNDVDYAQNCVIFVFDQTDCGQGYTKVKLFMNSTVGEVLHKKGTTVIDTHKGNFLSTRKIIDFYLNYLSNSNVPWNVYRHGPSTITVFKSKYDFGSKLIPDEVHEVDLD